MADLDHLIHPADLDAAAIDAAAQRIVDILFEPDSVAARAAHRYARWVRRDPPAIRVHRDDWNQIPVYTRSRDGYWYAKIPGTAWGNGRVARFATREACRAFCDQVYRELHGLGPHEHVPMRYEPPMRTWKLSPDELARLRAADSAPPGPPRIQHVPRLRSAADLAAEADFWNWLRQLEQRRAAHGTLDDVLEERRAPARPIYAGREPGGDDPDPFAYDDTAPREDMPDTRFWYLCPIARAGERVYVPWIWIRLPRTGALRYYARWAFLTEAAARRFAYDHGAAWVQPQRNKQLVEDDARQPFPLYVDPAVLAAARARLAALRARPAGQSA